MTEHHNDVNLDTREKIEDFEEELHHDSFQVMPTKSGAVYLRDGEPGKMHDITASLGDTIVYIGQSPDIQVHYSTRPGFNTKTDVWAEVLLKDIDDSVKSALGYQRMVMNDDKKWVDSYYRSIKRTSPAALDDIDYLPHYLIDWGDNEPFEVTRDSAGDIVRPTHATPNAFDEARQSVMGRMPVLRSHELPESHWADEMAMDMPHFSASIGKTSASRVDILRFGNTEHALTVNSVIVDTQDSSDEEAVNHQRKLAEQYAKVLKVEVRHYDQPYYGDTIKGVKNFYRHLEYKNQQSFGYSRYETSDMDAHLRLLAKDARTKLKRYVNRLAGNVENLKLFAAGGGMSLGLLAGLNERMDGPYAEILSQYGQEMQSVLMTLGTMAAPAAVGFVIKGHQNLVSKSTGYADIFKRGLLDRIEQTVQKEGIDSAMELSPRVQSELLAHAQLSWPDFNAEQLQTVLAKHDVEKTMEALDAAPANRNGMNP